MAKKEEVLASVSLANVLPVLSLNVVEVLSADLERAVTELGLRHDINGLRPLSAAVRSFCQECKARQDRLEDMLTIDTR